jgi:hypothetical protein
LAGDELESLGSGKSLLVSALSKENFIFKGKLFAATELNKTVIEILLAA